jgi:hypothetical protein
VPSEFTDTHIKVRKQHADSVNWHSSKAPDEKFLKKLP